MWGMEILNPQIEKDVRAELAGDPRIPVADEIAVEAFDGAVSLRGTVGSFAQRRAAVDDARRTEGVFDVYDELEVRLLDDERRADAEIRGEALQRLVSDPVLPVDWVDVHVRDGWVTLKGEVDHQYQSDGAFEHVTGLDGVTGVTNEIKVIEAS
jgi:osmotically-inducible protein OsmY